MRYLIISILLTLPTLIFSQTLSAEEIIKRVDKNRITDGKIVVIKNDYSWQTGRKNS